MPDGLYDSDVLTWSERQAGLLRRMAAGERVNDSVDWRAEVQACESLLIQAMAHVLKLRRWPRSASSGHWQAEAAAFLGRAGRFDALSMRQRIDMPALYRIALREVVLWADESGPGGSLPEACPFGLQVLLDQTAYPLDLAKLVGGGEG